jgi:hypothetical protein
MEVLFSSSYDDKFPPTAIFNSKKDFWTTTGLFPQEMVIQLDTARSIKSISLSSYALKKIIIETSEVESAMNFTKQAEMVDIPYQEGKLQEFFLNFSSPSKTKLLRIKVEEGYDDFVSIVNANLN